MAQPSSYTDEDIKKCEEYIEAHPKEKFWMTMEGLKIPIHMIKDDHLKNIKRFIDQHWDKYHPKVREMMNKEWRKRFASTPAGKVLFGP